MKIPTNALAALYAEKLEDAYDFSLKNSVNLSADDQVFIYRQLVQYQNYILIFKKEDGFIGLGRLMFTTAIYCDLTENGYTDRYCFENAIVALTEALNMKSVDDEPVGYVAKRVFGKCSF